MIYVINTLYKDRKCLGKVMSRHVVEARAVEAKDKIQNNVKRRFHKKASVPLVLIESGNHFNVGDLFPPEKDVKVTI